MSDIIVVVLQILFLIVSVAVAGLLLFLVASMIRLFYLMAWSKDP